MFEFSLRMSKSTDGHTFWQVVRKKIGDFDRNPDPILGLRNACGFAGFFCMIYYMGNVWGFLHNIQPPHSFGDEWP